MISRLLFAISACLLLSNCGLIGTALRLAPYYFLFADANGKETTGKSVEARGREVQDKRYVSTLPTSAGPNSQLAFER